MIFIKICEMSATADLFVLYGMTQRILHSIDENIVTAVVYRIKELNFEIEEGTYTGVTKRKISEMFNEHIRGLKYNGQTTALARSNIRTPLQIDSITIEENIVTAVVYGIKELNIEIEELTYTGVTKRKISEMFNEHIRDLKYNGQTTALARFNIRTPLQTDSITIEEIANYDSLYNALGQNQSILI